MSHVSESALAALGVARARRRADRRGALRVRAAARSAARAPRRRARRDGRAAGLAEPDSRNARGILRAAGVLAGGPGAAQRHRGRVMSATAAIALNVFRESVRDRVLYNLVLFAILLIGASYLHRPAHRRAGREDHQGPRPVGDVHVRAVHRRLHRHRPGVEGSRAAQRLQPAGQADSPLSDDCRQVRGPDADARREVSWSWPRWARAWCR